jgi:hypothetical protein
MTVIGYTSFAQYTDSTTRYINYSSTGSINKADNTSSYLLNNTIKIGIKKKSVSFNFNNSWIYGKQNSDITNNDFSSSLDFNLYKGIAHSFFWGLANYNTSYSLKINNQLLAGGGIAYSILDRPKAYLNLSDGILYDYSDLILADGTTDRYSTSRNSFRLMYKFLIGSFIELSGSNFIQNSLSDRHDFIIRTTSKASFKMNKWLSLTTQLDFNKMNRTSKENLLLSYGLSFERYF